jgi:flagellar biogenesis protein FliO
MSDQCANILLKVVVAAGLLLVFAGVMSGKVFAESVESPAGDTPTSQQASEKESDSDAATKTNVLPFGKKDDQSPLDLDNNGMDTSALLRQMLALVVIILVLGGACWFVLKRGLPRFRMAGSSRAREITVLETTYLPSRQSVYLLQVGSKKLLLAGGKEGLRMLADVTDGFPETPTDDDFRDVLSKQDAGRNEGQGE